MSLFPKQPEYIEAKRGFIQSLNVAQCDQVLDLACGTEKLAEPRWPRLPHNLG
jgi:hypothetical protein